MRTPKDVVRAWVEAFNRADVDALSALYADDAINHQVVREPMRGRAAIRSMFEREFAEAEMTCIVENLFEDGEWAILEWRDPLGLRGCGFFRVVDGRISLQRGYWDRLTFLEGHRGDAMSRPADVFFYGLFMDDDLLRSHGFSPQRTELASVDGFALRIGKRSALVPAPAGRVHGVVTSLTLTELDRLYAEPGLEAYRLVAVVAQLAAGGSVAALCYNLPEPPSPAERNPDYAARLRVVAEKVGLPPDYVASLR